MAKYYVKSNRQMRVIQAEWPVLAAACCLYNWRRCGLKVGATITVSEVGFDGDHPHHIKDVVLSTKFVKALIT